jgi:hypothetical protein
VLSRVSRYGQATYSRGFQNGTVIANPADGAVIPRTQEMLLDATCGQAARNVQDQIELPLDELPSYWLKNFRISRTTSFCLPNGNW